MLQSGLQHLYGRLSGTLKPGAADAELLVGAWIVGACFGTCALTRGTHIMGRAQPGCPTEVAMREAEADMQAPRV